MIKKCNSVVSNEYDNNIIPRFTIFFEDSGSHAILFSSLAVNLPLDATMKMPARSSSIHPSVG